MKNDEKRKLKKKLDKYQYTIRALLASTTKEKLNQLFESKSSELITGKCDIWYCSDGYIFAFENSFNPDICYGEIDCGDSSLLEVYNQEAKEFFTFHHLALKIAKKGYTASFTPESQLVNSLTLIIEDHAKSWLRPKYSKIMLMPKAFLKQHWKPIDAALSDFNSAIERTNLPDEKTAKDLIQSFKLLLEKAEKEEEIQVFLNNHPEFVFPEYESVVPKPGLGGDYFPDFAVSIRQNNGLQWVFVEIEKPSKRIFTQGKKNFQFTRDFTQAKGQLLEWDAYITQNLLFLRQKFPNLLKAKYCLIYGRNNELDENRRGMLISEFNESNNRSFLTYDDMIEKFEKIVERINQTARS